MYIILKKGKLKEILTTAIDKAGSIRKLSKQIGIPRSTIYGYYIERTSINEKNLAKFLKYLEIKLEKNSIINKFPNNFKQILGGKKCVEIKKKNGTFENQLKKCREIEGGMSLKKWHRNMKKLNSEKYYLEQYNRFKKSGNYKYLTKNNERVRNKLEKDVADILKELNLKYKYETIVKIENKFFFPDFLIDKNIIIECTEWRGFDKAIKLNKKIDYLKKEYKVYVVIPKTLKRYYEILNNCLVLGTDNLIQILKSL